MTNFWATLGLKSRLELLDLEASDNVILTDAERFEIIGKIVNTCHLLGPQLIVNGYLVVPVGNDSLDLIEGATKAELHQAIETWRKNRSQGC